MTIIDTLTRARDALQSERELAASSGGFSKVAEYAGLISDLNAAIAAAGWRPVGDIPDDIREDRCVLLYKPDEPRSGPETIVAYWGEWPGVPGYQWIRAGGKPIAWVSTWTGKPVPHGIVTHWMPLPAPPAKEPE